MNTEPIIEAILFASGEPVPITRLCALLDLSKQEVLEASKRLSDRYIFEQRGIRLLQLEDSLQLCSAPEYYDYIRKALETRKPPKLSSAALEVLAVAAYYQPVTRTFIEQIRGVDSSYTVNLLVEKGLIEPCGKLDVPGRPVIFKTTHAFLRSFNISSLSELPELGGKETDSFENEQLDIQNAIENLRLMEARSGQEPERMPK
ncbi:MAG: SMC-Scp complex subunit ScpB [Clostridiales bacterium]|nr:SMC-Scp complex subunit ScpB [Clostridiales bacterium]